MKRRGITLIELVITFLGTALIVGGAAVAMGEGWTYLARAEGRNEDHRADVLIQKRIQDLLRGAYVGSDSTDTSTYFIGAAAASLSATTTSSTSSSSSSGSSSSDTIVFTTLGQVVPGYELNSTDDFQTQNAAYGPRGGAEEVSLSTTAVGDNGQNKTGLFLRTQYPSDEDPTQGGYEELLLSGVQNVSFEFWDGSSWIGTWDTRSGTRRLPAAVLMTYELNGDSTQRSIVVRLPSSDVTATNPITSSTSTGGGQ